LPIVFLLGGLHTGIVINPRFGSSIFTAFASSARCLRGVPYKYSSPSNKLGLTIVGLNVGRGAVSEVEGSLLNIVPVAELLVPIVYALLAAIVNITISFVSTILSATGETDTVAVKDPVGMVIVLVVPEVGIPV
jgi:hypothetical protein